MFQEEVADFTAKHLRGHIAAYLTAVGLKYPDDVVLQIPKAIEVDNLVGGVYNAAPDEMPAYAVDIIDLQFDGVSPEGLWMYSYNGHIAGVVSGGDESVVNKMIKRHEQATQMFVNDHQYFHSTESPLGQDFKILELGMSGAAFSGAELINEENNRQLWMAGFRIDLIWGVSQAGPNQH